MAVSFEFVVNGPPYSGNNDVSKPKTDWKQAVGQAAYQQWLADGLNEALLPLTMPLEVFVTTYCTNDIYDVDNVLKWTLDGLSVDNRPADNLNSKQAQRAAKYKSIYADDRQIFRITSERVDVRGRQIESSAPPLVLTMQEREDAVDFLHIRIVREEGEM